MDISITFCLVAREIAFATAEALVNAGKYIQQRVMNANMLNLINVIVVPMGNTFRITLTFAEG